MGRSIEYVNTDLIEILKDIDVLVKKENIRKVVKDLIMLIHKKFRILPYNVSLPFNTYRIQYKTPKDKYLIDFYGSDKVSFKIYNGDKFKVILSKETLLVLLNEDLKSNIRKYKWQNI